MSQIVKVKHRIIGWESNTVRIDELGRIICINVPYNPNVLGLQR